MNTTIDISRPLRRNIINRTENRRIVKMESPAQQWHTVDDVFAMVEKKINDRYGTNYKI